MPEGLPLTEIMLGGLSMGLIAAFVLVMAERSMNPRLRVLLLVIGFVLCLLAVVVVVFALREMPQPE